MARDPGRRLLDSHILALACTHEYRIAVKYLRPSPRSLRDGRQMLVGRPDGRPDSEFALLDGLPPHLAASHVIPRMGNRLAMRLPV